MARAATSPSKTKPVGARNGKLLVEERVVVESNPSYRKKLTEATAAAAAKIAGASADVEEEVRRRQAVNRRDQQKHQERKQLGLVKPQSKEVDGEPLPATAPDGEIQAAVMASLYLNQPVAQIAAQYGLTHNQVYTWKLAFDSVESILRRDRLSEMLMVYIEQEIKSLMAISIVTSDKEWIFKQNAGDLAMYFATKSDRVMQILQAFGRVSDSRQNYVTQLEAFSEGVESKE